MAIGYVPANALDADKAITSVRVEHTPGGDILVIALGEQRVGLTRTLTRKVVTATDDDTGFKRTWESIWDDMNDSMDFHDINYDRYSGDLGDGDPMTDLP